MKNVRLFPLLFLFGCLFSSCFEGKTGKGPLVDQSFPTGKFNKVVLNMDAEIELSFSDNYSVDVQAQENLIEQVAVRVSGQTLVITSKGIINPTRPIRIKVSMPYFELLEVNGSGNVEFMDTLKTDYADIEVNGSGQVNGLLKINKLTCAITGSGELTLAGRADNFAGEIFGSGTIRADSLSTDYTRIAIGGSGEVMVRVDSILECEINGSGTVKYLGDPELKTKINGSGSVSRL